MKKLFLHVGAGKTGTSAIQSCLTENMVKLRERGVLYPTHEMLAIPGADVPSSGNGGPLFLYLLPQGRLGPLDEAAFLENFASVLSGPAHTVVISNEMLEYGVAEKFTVLRDFCAAQDAEIKIVYLVRDIAAHAFSAWGQVATHHGYLGGWSEFQTHYATKMNTFAAPLAKFASVFPRENLVVANYSSLGRRVTEWFFATIGQNYAIYRAAHEVNLASSLATIALMLEFNKCLKEIFGDATGRPLLRGPFYAAIRPRTDLNDIEGRRFSLTADEYQVLKEKCQETVDQVNTVYLRHDPIKIAEPDEIGGPLKMPELTREARQAIRLCVEEIVADSAAPGEHASLATRLDDILGSVQLFVES